MTRTLILLFALLLTGSTALAQQTPSSADGSQERLFGNGIGLNISLTNSGFGLGGYWQKALSVKNSVITEFTIMSGKDEREQRFFNFWGESFIPNKANYLLSVPIYVGLQRRLFADAIQDNFRPFLQFSAGPTFGWTSPYFRDLNNNGVRDPNERSYDAISAIPKGEARFGFGGIIAIGANFGISRRVTQGLRFGYSFNYFSKGVQLLEPDIKPAQKFFGTPTISLVFGRVRG